MLIFSGLDLWQVLSHRHMVLEGYFLCLVVIQLACRRRWPSHALFLVRVQVIDQRLQLDLRILGVCSMGCRHLVWRGKFIVQVVSSDTASHRLCPVVRCLHNNRLDAYPG